MMHRGIGVFLASLLVVSACTSGEDGSMAGGGARPSSTATIDLVEPEPGTVVTGGEMTVRMELEGGEIVDETSTDLTPDEGHVHVRVDGRTLTETFGLTQQLEVRESCEGVERCVEPGNHLLEVEFVAKDHARFDPRVLDSTSFEVRL